ncbi:asparaginyl t-RNA synthetase [Tupanvirus deep ocean]|uniref:Asparaginyl t-RNA synthetase n=2 Tax=Tupanvirus TaxID=2094720 RepID=A0AC62A6U7_9VIRU|nr:asparaginyl t-RNA synthetase [Tupanvirus deep ocean]QKU33482.1 asparaginyl t-RNA synthetase [Tupanvirus deep ocean]
MQIAEIFKSYTVLLGQEVTTAGWVKTCRDQNQMIFVHLSDGTTQQTLQVIALPEFINNFKELSVITTGTSISVTGVLVKSPAKGQLFELSARSVIIHQICPGTFPFQKVGLPMEFMRTFPHLRHRSNIMRAVFSVKSVIMKSIHDFFVERNYCLVDLPILTTNACEGGCQPLQVTSLIDSGKISDIPVITKDVITMGDDKNGVISNSVRTIKTNDIDFKKDFFDNPVYLTVSNQLHLECFAHGLGYVYTITPATRGEPSQSTKHLAHFNMLEWEFCFGELDDNIELAEQCIKYCAAQVLEKSQKELDILNKAAENKLIEKLVKIVTEPFARISHREAVTLLRDVHLKIPFVDEPQYAGDLSGEHERYLVKHFGKPVVVMRYPKAVKAFYMPVHHTIETIEYVDCFDLLMDIGEVVGGSQRIWSESDLLQRMAELGIDSKHLDWYLDLRRYGSVPHGGAGLGIERLVATLTGTSNVKDCISFPLTVHHCTH